MKTQKQFKKLIWDYALTPKEFSKILKGQNEKGWFTKEWATSRVLENLNYYQAKELVDWDFVKEHWQKIKPKIYNRTIKDGYEYLLRRDSLPSSK